MTYRGVGKRFVRGGAKLMKPPSFHGADSSQGTGAGAQKKRMSLEPGFPVFRETVPAIDRAALGGLERHFTVLPTVGAGGLEHLAVIAAVVALPAVRREAFFTIDGPVARRLERHFTLFSTVGTDYSVHFPWAPVSKTGTPIKSSIIH
jgi:hypothetical protein